VDSTDFRSNYGILKNNYFFNLNSDFYLKNLNYWFIIDRGFSLKNIKLKNRLVVNKYTKNLFNFKSNVYLFLKNKIKINGNFLSKPAILIKI
jgi:hypothetical protein